MRGKRAKQLRALVSATADPTQGVEEKAKLVVTGKDDKGKVTTSRRITLRHQRMSFKAIYRKLKKGWTCGTPAVMAALQGKALKESEVTNARHK